MAKYLLTATYTADGAKGLLKDGGSKRRTAATLIAINASGAVRTKTVVLLTPEEVDQATKKAVTYNAPGH
jgi:uncharacterized protein with GYD domain